MNNKINTKTTQILLIIPTIFLGELILGLNGKLLVIGGIPIRQILYWGSLLSLSMTTLFVMKKKQISFFSKSNKSLLGDFDRVDWLFVFLTATTLFYTFIVPFFNQGSIMWAIKEVAGFVMLLVLFFPLRFLIKMGVITLKRLNSYIYWLVFLFSLFHVFLYLGQSVDEHFIENVFVFMDKLTLGHSQLPEIILGHGHGVARVIFGTSIYITVGIYFFFKRLESLDWKNLMVFAVHVTALLATLTKSFWLGVLVGGTVFVLHYVYSNLKDRNMLNIKRLFVVLGGTLVFTIILNFAIFNNSIYARFLYFFSHGSSSQGGDNGDGGVISNDEIGANISNSIRIEQSRILIQAALKNPIFGIGYGGFVEEYLRSTINPFSYEMLLPALFLKIGITGLLTWLVFGILLVLEAFKKLKETPLEFSSWLFLFVAFVVSIQFFPILFTLTGASILVYLGLVIPFEEN